MTDARDTVSLSGRPALVLCALARAQGNAVQGTSLAGCTILIAEDEPFIAMDIAAACETAGAMVLTAATCKDAARRVEHDTLTAAVIDFGLRDGHADPLCLRLNERNVPYVLHSGYTHFGDTCHRGIVIAKPAHPTTLIEAIEDALRRRI